MSQTLTKPILLDETGQAIKTALQNIDETESQDWLLSYEDVHSEMDDTLQDMATSLKAIKNILDHGSMFEIPQWSSGSDEDIAKALALHYEGVIDLHDYWSVGDERVVHIPAITDKVNSEDDDICEQDITLVLLNAGGKDLTTSINNHDECAFVVGMKQYFLSQIATDNVYGAKRVCVSDDYTETSSAGWDNIGIRNWSNTSFRNALPSSLKSIFKQFKVISTKAYKDTDPSHTTPASKNYAEEVDTDDYFVMPSMTEIFGSTYLNQIRDNWSYNGVYAIESKLNQFDYYKNALARTNIFYSNDYYTSTYLISRTIFNSFANASNPEVYKRNDTYTTAMSVQVHDYILLYGVI